MGALFAELSAANSIADDRRRMKEREKRAERAHHWKWVDDRRRRQIRNKPLPWERTYRGEETDIYPASAVGNDREVSQLWV
ncbi:MAG: hypothetical protein LBB15_03035 [Puniceicoccales bacterium]|nr:hypothetical protein [Puniceicoccales bacterium]